VPTGYLSESPAMSACTAVARVCGEAHWKWAIIVASMFRRWPSVESGQEGGELPAFGGGEGC
jgi:hypothetical protein